MATVGGGGVFEIGGDGETEYRLPIPGPDKAYPLVQVYAQDEAVLRQVHADIVLDRSSGEIIVRLASPVEAATVVCSPLVF